LATRAEKLSSELANLRASVGAQPRAKHHKALVPEFKSVLTVETSEAEMKAIEEQMTPEGLPQAMQLRGGLIPKGSKLIRAECMREGKGVTKAHACWTIVVGTAEWEPQEFIKKALGCAHPFLASDRSLDDVKEAALRTLARGPARTSWWRRSVLERWRRRGKKLEQAEAELHSKMNKSVARVMKGKKILLLKVLGFQKSSYRAQFMCFVC
jgi:hypothetical protein